MPEWSNGTVLKTVAPATVPWVRIPPPPPELDFGKLDTKDSENKIDEMVFDLCELTLEKREVVLNS